MDLAVALIGDLKRMLPDFPSNPITNNMTAISKEQASHNRFLDFIQKFPFLDQLKGKGKLDTSGQMMSSLWIVFVTCEFSSYHEKVRKLPISNLPKSLP